MKKFFNFKGFEIPEVPKWVLVMLVVVGIVLAGTVGTANRLPGVTAAVAKKVGVVDSTLIQRTSEEIQKWEEARAQEVWYQSWVETQDIETLLAEEGLTLKPETVEVKLLPTKIRTRLGWKGMAELTSPNSQVGLAVDKEIGHVLVWWYATNEDGQNLKGGDILQTNVVGPKQGKVAYEKVASSAK